MLSRAVRDRIAKNRKIHRRPKKRRAVIARRLGELMAISFQANVSYGKHGDVRVNDIEYAKLMETRAQLKARHAAEDRVYFNGWRKGYK